MGNTPEYAAITDQPDDISDPELEETFQKIAESRGYVSNLMQTIAHAPEGLHPFAALGQYCRYGTELTERQKEIAILVALRDVHYGLRHHVPLARAAGLTEEQVLLIQEGRVPRDLDPVDHVLCEFAFEIAACRHVPPRIEQAIHAQFQPRQIVDIALLTSYYMATAAMIIALDVQLEAPEVLAHEQAWQDRFLPPPAPLPEPEDEDPKTPPR